MFALHRTGEVEDARTVHERTADLKAPSILCGGRLKPVLRARRRTDDRSLLGQRRSTGGDVGGGAPMDTTL